jgi:eukaryotic-like serine/threonine-protein kinase
LSLNAPSRYRILGPVASGGMGAVQLALASEGKGAGARVVAVKQLHAHLTNDPRMVEMLLDEARIASRMFHPNIVRVSDVEMIHDDIVLVMDYVEGVSLSALLRWLSEQGKTMPVAVANLIVRDVLAGLHAAHELHDESGALLGVIHRDVSPQNVLVGTDGVARITDFGVAKARGRIASTKTDGPVKGKLRYLAPEQVYRKPTDRRVDIFAAGVVLWECLAGRRLFDGVTEGETLASVLTSPIDPPSAHRFEIPIELDEICMRALERDPKRRWSTANDFANALESTKLAERSELSALVSAAGAESIERLRVLVREGESRGADARSAALPAPPEASSRQSRTSVVAVGAAIIASAVLGGVLTKAYATRPIEASPAASIGVPSEVAPITSEPSASAPTVAVSVASSAPAPAPSATAKESKPTRRKARPRTDGGVPAFDPTDL